jgi:hypothetical protein
MWFLLSIKTVFPKPGGKSGYNDQREVFREAMITALQEPLRYRGCRNRCCSFRAVQGALLAPWATAASDGHQQHREREAVE